MSEWWDASATWLRLWFQVILTTQRMYTCFSLVSFFFFFPWGFWGFFQDSSLSFVLVKRIKICRYLSGPNALYVASAILFTLGFVANYLAGMSG